MKHFISMSVKEIDIFQLGIISQAGLKLLVRSSLVSVPLHKLKSPTTLVPVASPVPGVLSPVCADLLPPPKRIRDSNSMTDLEVRSEDRHKPHVPRETSLGVDVEDSYEPYTEPKIDPNVQAGIDECIAFSNALRVRGTKVRVVVETMAEEEVETGARGTFEVEIGLRVRPVVYDDVREPVREDVPDHVTADEAVKGTYETLGNLVHRIVEVDLEVTTMMERMSALEQYNTRLRGMLRVREHTMLPETEDEMKGEQGNENVNKNENENGNMNGNRNGNGNGNPNQNNGGQCVDMVEFHKQTVRADVAYAMTWSALMKLMTERFQELVFLCTKMVPDEVDRVEKLIGGLPKNIHGNVIVAEPTRLQDAICIANNLMDQKLKGYAARNAENKRRFNNNPRIMESIKKEAYLMKVQLNGANKYQVSGLLGDQCVVDVGGTTPRNMEFDMSSYTFAPKHHVQVGRPRKKRKRSKHENEPFVKVGKLSRKGRTITCQSCGNIGHNKATCKGQGPNNVKASGSASRQAQQTELVGGQDGSGASAVIGLSVAGGQGVFHFPVHQAFILFSNHSTTKFKAFLFILLEKLLLMSTTRDPIVLDDSTSNPSMRQDDPMIDDKNGSNEEFQTSKRKKAIDNGHPKSYGSNISSSEPALEAAIVNGKYDHMRMRESIAHWILMHEHSFSIVEEAGFDFMMKVGIPQWPGLSHASKSDCIRKIGYMVVTSHFLDNKWKLNKWLLNFVHIPPPHRGIDISDALYKCFQEWDIENKIYSSSMDNASSNDNAIKNLRRILETRWNSTYEMLSSAYKFKEIFPKYQERDTDYESCPLKDDWAKVEQICGILEVFSNKDDEKEFIREMVKKMKEKFDKYWAEVDLLMAIVAVLDPWVKKWSLKFCFPKIYNPTDCKALVEMVEKTLKIYTPKSKTSMGYGFEEVQNFVRQNETAPMQKTDLDSNESKYRILCKLARDILAIPITTVASEATFSAGSRVIDQYRASLGVETVQALLCGGN
ncbi:zinc finger BED domain-containing protein RICESLEEPER 2-like protein [Tanacetum coccineum]|uniref:Zinc finger BED domain-containing protein RICESLEEPER 2-like protein n=1 Tax=Tanacetum coccineum TaxID=301880 RepID=A0ABQ5ACG7_9ASTR